MPAWLLPALAGLAVGILAKPRPPRVDIPVPPDPATVAQMQLEAARPIIEAGERRLRELEYPALERALREAYARRYVGVIPGRLPGKLGELGARLEEQIAGLRGAGTKEAAEAIMQSILARIRGDIEAMQRQAQLAQMGAMIQQQALFSIIEALAGRRRKPIIPEFFELPEPAPFRIMRPWMYFPPLLKGDEK